MVDAHGGVSLHGASPSLANFVATVAFGELLCVCV